MSRWRPCRYLVGFEGKLAHISSVEVTVQSDRERRLELARNAFKDYYAQCFWSSDPDLVVEEKYIPLIIRNLRLHGGHKGFRLAAELCRSETSNAK